ncbi:hypothetical protein ABFX02_06G031700 [Erythranthe guttata]
MVAASPFRGGGFSGDRGDGGGRGGGRSRGGGAMKRGGGRGAARGNRGGRIGMKGGIKVVVEPHRHAGVFIAKGKDDALCTKNMVPGETVYNEKRVSVQNEDGTKTEYIVWNPFRSKLAAAILSGVETIWIKPGSSVLYLGAASGTSVSHVSDIVGPSGVVYAVEFSHRSGRDLVNLAKKRTNIIPIIEDARYPGKYRMLVGMVDVIFSDVAQPDQVCFLLYSTNCLDFLLANVNVNGQYYSCVSYFLLALHFIYLINIFIYLFYKLRFLFLLLLVSAFYFFVSLRKQMMNYSDSPSRLHG